MCGIVGLLVKKPELREQLGELMMPILLGMTWRGPESAGMAVFGLVGLSAGRMNLRTRRQLSDQGPIGAGGTDTSRWPTTDDRPRTHFHP